MIRRLRSGPLSPLVLFALAAISLGASSDSPTVDPSGTWGGAIELPAGELEVRVEITRIGGAWAGTIDIPAQGASDLELHPISVEADRITFSIAGLPGVPTFRGRLAGDALSGRFTQGDATLEFRLTRGQSAATGRPQEPSPPLPYSEEAVTLASGAIDLAGTLTLPASGGPHPAVVLLTGSGPQNRDGEVFGHKPFLVLADHLTRRGIVVLRLDDRGVGGSGGDLDRSTTADLADDAVAAARWLAARPEVDPSGVGLVGHSEGGLVAPLAAGRSPEVRFVVLLAAPAVPGDELLIRQNGRLLAAQGTAEDDITAQIEMLRDALAAFHDGRTRSERASLLRRLARRQIQDLPPAQRQALGDAVGEQVDQQVAAALTPWFEFFVAYDPVPALRELQRPTLAIYGGRDLQVDPAQNLPAMRHALTANPDATVLQLDGLNHLLQTANSGSPLEYALLDETMSPRVLERIAGWILERAAPPAEPAAATTASGL